MVGPVAQCVCCCHGVVHGKRATVNMFCGMLSNISSTYTERCKGIRIKSTAKAKQVNLIIQTINAMITIPTYDHADDIDAIHDDRMPDAE